MPRSVAGAKSGAGSDLRTDKSAAKAKAAKDDIQVGDAISAAHGGGAEWYSGRVAEVAADGTYAVRFDDGQDYGGTIGDALDERSAACQFDDGTSDVIRFPDPDVRVTRVGPEAPAAKPAAKPRAKPPRAARTAPAAAPSSAAKASPMLP